MRRKEWAQSTLDVHTHRAHARLDRMAKRWISLPRLGFWLQLHTPKCADAAKSAKHGLADRSEVTRSLALR
jgi:hypothetical protein